MSQDYNCQFVDLINSLTGDTEALMCTNCKKIFLTVNHNDVILKNHSNGVECQVINDEHLKDFEKTCEITEDKRTRSCESEITRNKLHELLTKMFVACNIAFRSVENEHFKNFIKALQSYSVPYEPPSRKTLASSNIARVYDDIVEKRKKLLNNTDSVLLVDGWKNKNNNKKFLVFSLKNINTTHTFLTCTDYTLESEDGESLARAINDAITFAKEKYNTNVYAIVTDNDSKIVCGGGKADANDAKLWQSTCNSHSGNLLLKSLIDLPFSNTVRSVVSAFRDSKLQALLIDEGGTKLENYPDTRFCFFRNTCKSVLKNLNILQRIAMVEEIDLDENVFNTIFDESFKVRLSETIDLLDPVCKLINVCQNPKSNVADAVEMWLSLNHSGQYDQKLIDHRVEKAIWDSGYAANMLHPKYQGLSLSEKGQKCAFNFFYDYFDHATLQELDRFLNSREEKIQKLLLKCHNPLTFWNLIDYFYPSLSKAAIKLSMIPASTAELEGLFSHWTYVHNSYRNRLSVGTSEKLVDIYYSLRHFKLDSFNQNYEDNNPTCDKSEEDGV